MPKVSTLVTIYPNDCDILRQIRNSYADRIYFLNREYICYYFGKNSKPFEHRLVAELAFGAIPEGYHVHHINGTPGDNRICNLAILSKADHARLHHGYSPVIQCAWCHQPTEVHFARILRSSQVYCSRRCRGLAQRKANRPSKEYFAELLYDLQNWSAIGRMYGVSDNAVRKWAKSFGIDPKAFGRSKR